MAELEIARIERVLAYQYSYLNRIEKRCGGQAGGESEAKERVR